MKLKLLALFTSVFLGVNSFAHFQMLYTNETVLDMGKKIDMNIIFTHPFTGAYTMNMSDIDEFYVINKKRKDLKNLLKEQVYKDISSEGKGYKLKYNARRMGDHLFVMKPKPYYDVSTKNYIQQITKTIINVAGIPTVWDKELGLKAEIVPLTKPYSIWAGSNFTGIVKSNGKVVPYAKIEVKYLNRKLDTKKYILGKPQIKAPHDVFVNMVIKANSLGEFSYTIPKEGFWGFKAMGVGPDKKYKGKKLEQDAVIWVQARKMQ